MTRRRCRRPSRVRAGLEPLGRSRARARVVLAVALSAPLVGCGPVVARVRIGEAQEALRTADRAAEAGRPVDRYHHVRARAYLLEAQRQLGRAHHGWAISLAQDARRSADEALVLDQNRDVVHRATGVDDAPPRLPGSSDAGPAR